MATSLLSSALSMAIFVALAWESMLDARRSKTDPRPSNIDLWKAVVVVSRQCMLGNRASTAQQSKCITSYPFIILLCVGLVVVADAILIPLTNAGWIWWRWSILNVR